MWLRSAEGRLTAHRADRLRPRRLDQPARGRVARHRSPGGARPAPGRSGSPVSPGADGMRGFQLAATQLALLRDRIDRRAAAHGAPLDAGRRRGAAAPGADHGVPVGVRRARPGDAAGDVGRHAATTWRSRTAWSATIDEPPTPVVPVPVIRRTADDAVLPVSAALDPAPEGPARAAAPAGRRASRPARGPHPPGTAAPRRPRPRPRSAASMPTGCGSARNEYGATVVLAAAFWLQSMNTLPGRSAFAIRDTTSFGCAALQLAARSAGRTRRPSPTTASRRSAPSAACPSCRTSSAARRCRRRPSDRGAAARPRRTRPGRPTVPDRGRPRSDPGRPNRPSTAVRAAPARPGSPARPGWPARPRPRSRSCPDRPTNPATAASRAVPRRADRPARSSRRIPALSTPFG